MSRWLGFLDVFTDTSDRFIANHNTQSNPFITCLYELTLWNSVAKNTWISATSYCEYYKRHYFIKGTSFFPALTPKPIYYIQHFWGCWLVYILSWKCPPSLPCSTGDVVKLHFFADIVPVVSYCLSTTLGPTPLSTYKAKAFKHVFMSFLVLVFSPSLSSQYLKVELFFLNFLLNLFFSLLVPIRMYPWSAFLFLQSRMPLELVANL